MTDNPILIHYLVIIDDDVNGFSPICGYNFNLFFYKDVFSNIFSFPLDVFEIGKNWCTITKHRLFSPNSHIIIPLIYDSYIKIDNYIPFICVIYDKKKYPDLEKIEKKNWKNKPFFIDIGKIEKITFKDFYDYFNPIITEFFANTDYQYTGVLEPDVRLFLNELFDGFIAAVLPAFMRKGNNALLESQIIGFNKNMQNVLKLDNKRTKGIDCIFTSLPQYPSYYIEYMFSERIKSNPSKRKELKKVYRQADYESTCIVDTEIYNTRRNEIEVYLCFMKFVFENYMCPLIQIQPAINFIANYLLQAINKAKSEKQAKIYNQFLDEVNKYAKKEFLDFIPSDKIPRVKIYSDAPIEFFINNEYRLPIHISTNLCKIPMTPGTDFVNLISRSNETFMTYKELTNILVISSFKPEDKTRTVLKDRLKSQTGFVDVKVVIKDVKNADEMVDVLNHSSEFKIVIFDCHGKHGVKDYFGVLQLEEDDFNIWQERQRITYLPPIIFFSACQTNIYGNTMYSTASGFLAAGARTILATTTSVDAESSADFMARIILKIDWYKDVLCEIFPKITLLDFVSNMFRVFYITDILDALKIQENESVSIISYTSVYINNESIYWYDFFLQQLSINLNKSKDEIIKMINTKVGFCESLKYILLGNADKIIISKEIMKSCS